MNDRGASIMIGYVLLIVVVIALSVLVFVYLGLYAPVEPPKCQSGVAVTVESATCQADIVTFTVVNDGRFTVDAILVTIGNATRLVRDDLNEHENGIIRNDTDGVLSPGERWVWAYAHEAEPGANELRFEPVQYMEDNTRAYCSEGTATYILTCP